MFGLCLAVLVTFALILASEYLWRRKNYHPELARKLVHISVGTFVAFWPFFLNWTEIKVLSLAFLVAVIISKYFNVFRAMHSVQRPTWGEALFAIVVGVLAFTADNKWVYATALLQMSLADGLAAVIGTLYGRRNQYKIFGYTKSVVGTLTFFGVSLLILLGYQWVSGADVSLALIFSLAAGATVLENILVRGFDNLLVPLFIALFL
jgi:dolichol kinase